MTCQEIALQSYVLSVTPCQYQTPFHSRLLQCMCFGHTTRKLHLTKFLKMKLVTSVPHPLRVHPNMPYVLGTLFPYQKSERSTFLQPPSENPHNFSSVDQKWIQISASHPSVLHQIVDTGAGQCSCLYPKLETAYLILTFKLFLFMIVTAVLFFPVSQAIWTFHSDEHNIFFWHF